MKPSKQVEKGRGGAGKPGPEKVRVRKWYFCCNEYGLVGDGEYGGEGMVRAAVNSCLQNTHLEPHFVYDGGEVPFLDWLRKKGVHVHVVDNPHRERIDAVHALSEHQKRLYAGYYLKFEVPKLELEDEYVLYTDVDVLFLRDVSKYKFDKPKIMAAARRGVNPKDTKAKLMNSGVILFNVKGFMSAYERLVGFALENGFNLQYSNPDAYGGKRWGGDQGVLLAVLGEGISALSRKLNWNIQWGVGDDVYIVHFTTSTRPHLIDAVRGSAPKGGVGLGRKLLARAKSKYVSARESYDYYCDLWLKYRGK